MSWGWYVFITLITSATFFAVFMIIIRINERDDVDERDGLEEWSGALPDTIISLDVFTEGSDTKAVRITQRRS